MRQILQSLKNGETLLVECPSPQMQEGSVLIKSNKSLVSKGTEGMLIGFGKSGPINKIKSQPEKVNQVIKKVKTDGLINTTKAVLNKLSEPIPLGYCNVGTIIDISTDVAEFKIGDRVISNGPHAEIINVKKNLVSKIPENVSDEAAAFTVIGAIGLQGIRLIKPKIGETVVVFGLGLIGLLSVQVLRANGCRVIGIDIDESKCELAKKYGAKAINPVRENPVKAIHSYTNNFGSDSVLITASSKNNDIILQSSEMVRKKGKIVLVGVVGLEIDRSIFYEKELSFQVSCSYGPGRYDSNYEEKGIDYPLPYVRWTEKRNFDTILKLISNKSINTDNLISRKVDLLNFNEIYENINNDKSIASIINYPDSDIDFNQSMKIDYKKNNKKKYDCNIGVIGSGNFSRMTLLPNLNNCNVNFKTLSSQTGISAESLSRKYKFEKITSNYKEIITDKSIDTVFIVTRHDSHAKIIQECLNSDKNVFVEKPLALNIDEVNSVINSIKPDSNLMVGFNRRFSPHIRLVKDSINKDKSVPLNIIINMNAGFISPEHWVHDLQIGGGRIIGEACHLIDLCVYISGSKVERICLNSLGNDSSKNTDNVSMLLKMKNGSNASINYFSNGSNQYSKERVEIYSQNRTWIIDNYERTVGYGIPGFKNLKTKVDKGHKTQFKKYIHSLKEGSQSLIPIEDIVNVTVSSIKAIDSFQKNKWIEI